jgi:hypothetical protein
VLLPRQVLNVKDALVAFELQEVVEQGDEQRLAGFDAEDPLEDEVSLGVGENGVHGSSLGAGGPRGNASASAGSLDSSRHRALQNTTSTLGDHTSLMTHLGGLP